MLNSPLNLLQWKVCGMRDRDNIAEVLLLEPNFMGFIFYPKSPRYVIDSLKEETLLNFPSKTKKVGVFVDQDIVDQLAIARSYQLDYFQLHGSETPENCKTLKEEGFGIIKAFSIGEAFDYKQLLPYIPFVDIFLFDTKAEGAYGGHGKTFNWDILLAYTYTTPFLLAGGIDLDNLDKLSLLKHLPLLGIDVNSKFEIEKGVKDLEKLKKLKEYLNQFNNNVF